MPRNELQKELGKVSKITAKPGVPAGLDVRVIRGMKGDRGEPGKDGKDGKPGKDGRDGSPDTGEDIVKKLESLPDDKKLSYDGLKNVPEIGRMIQQAVRQAGGAKQVGGSSSRDYAYTELTDTPKSYVGHAGEFLKVNATENGLDYGSPSGNPFGHEEFTASGGQTLFTLSFSYTPGNYRLQVFVNGLLARVGAGNDYLESSTTQVTFNYGLVAGDEVAFHLN